MVSSGKKEVPPFYYIDKTHEEMVEEIKKEFPIDLSKSEELINRIYYRYKLIDKSKVALIVKLVFESIRELIILGNNLHFNKLFFNTKLFVFSHTKGDTVYPAIRVKTGTPKHFRMLNDE